MKHLKEMPVFELGGSLKNAVHPLERLLEAVVFGESGHSSRKPRLFVAKGDEIRSALLEFIG